jgi:hypothetical protein
LTLFFVLWAGVVLGRLVSAYQDAGLYDEAIRTGQEAIQMMESNLTGLAALRGRMLGGDEVYTCDPLIICTMFTCCSGACTLERDLFE